MQNSTSSTGSQYQAGNAAQSVDPTEAKRRELLFSVNASPLDRAALEARHGRVWRTEELGRDFEVLGFAAPFVVVRRKSDGRAGSLMIQHHPRFYFSFEADHE
jgi:hypothetical protein